MSARTCACGHPINEHDAFGCQYSISQRCPCKRPWGQDPHAHVT